MSEWSEMEYGGTYKIYLDGLVRGNCSYAMTGEKGYIASIGRITLTKRFPDITEAQEALDNLILKRIHKYLKRLDNR
jgi:hypothetical protein